MRGRTIRSPGVDPPPDPRLRVTVVEQETGRPLEGAQVRLPGANLATVTDARGRAEVAGIPAGEQHVVARRIGYHARTVLVDFTSGAEVDAEFPLQTAPADRHEQTLSSE